MGASAGSSMMPSWSSEICSSAAEHSMPRLSTPLIVPTPSVMFLPGMKVPGGENTLTRPARAFGAPQTTCTGAPRPCSFFAPVSTMQTRSRSAFGCCSAEITRAIENGESAFALSSICSTSSPIMVSLSASFSRGSSVSRCSLSQESVNFMTVASLVPSPACGGGLGWGLSRRRPQQLSRERRRDWSSRRGC